MKITYHGHSCFTISSEGFTIAIDPYDDRCGYPPLSLEANKVYCSHSHFDHAYVQAVKLLAGGPAEPFSVKEIEVPHDKDGGAKRGMNLIRVFSAEGKRIIHFGDTGCMPKAEVLEALKGADVAMLPVGGFFTIEPAEAKEIADIIRPKTVIPMHYKKGSTGLGQIAELNVFTDLCKGTEYEVKPLEYKEVFEI